MSFLSGLKAAYDSIGSEFNKTFDSSKENPSKVESQKEPGSEPEQLPEIQHTGTVDQSSIYSTPIGQDGGSRSVADSRKGRARGNDGFADNWGKWEDEPPQTKSTSRQSESQSLSPPSSQESTTPLPIIKSVSVDKAGGQGGGDRNSGEKTQPLATSTPAKQNPTHGKSQLESLSREDLIKYIKKQGALLQKTKSRSEELMKECERLKKAGMSSGGGEESVLREELQVVRSERDTAVSERKSLRQTVAILQREKQDLVDRSEALEEAHSKLKLYFQDQQLVKEKESTSNEEAEKLITEQSEKEQQIELENSKLKSDVNSLQEQLEKSSLETAGKIKQLEKEKHSIEVKYAELLKKAKKLQGEMKVAKEKVVSHESLNDEMKVLREENQNLVSEISRLKEALELSEKQLLTGNEALGKQLEEAKMECSELEKSLTCSTKKEKALSEELREMRSNLTQLEQSHVTIRENEEALNGELEEMKLKYAELEQNLADTIDNKTALSEELKEANSKYIKLEQSFLDKGAEEALKEELSISRAECSRLEQSLSEEKHQTGLQSETLRKLQEANSESQCRVSELEEKCHLLTDQLKEVMKEKAELMALKTELAQMEERLQQSTTDSDQDKHQLQDKLAGLESRTKELESDLEKTVSELDEFRRENSELQRMVELEKKSFQEETSKNLELEKQLQVRLEEAEAIRRELLDLNQRYSETELQLKTANAEIVNLQSVMTSNEQERDEKVLQVERLSGELASLRQELDGVRKENATLNDQVDGLSEDHVKEIKLSSEEQNKELRSECDRLKEELSQLHTSVEAMIREREELKEEVKDKVALKKEVDELKLSMEKDAAAHKEENKKLKAFVIKFKKELSETRERESSLAKKLEDGQGISHGEVEELQTRLRSVNKDKKKLEESQKDQMVAMQAKLEECSSVIDQLSAEGERLRGKVVELEDGKEVFQSELASLQSDLATLRSERNTQQMATEAAKSEVRGAREELEKEKEAHKETRQKLGLMEKEAKSSTLMNMELEDYQKSIQALEAELADKQQLLDQTERMTQMHQESMQHLRKDTELLTQQRAVSEETVTKLKQLLVKNKKELAEGKRREEDLQATIGQLQSQLEAEKQGSEQAKVEVSQFMGKIESIKQQSELSVENLQRANRNLEHRLTKVQAELTATQEALTTTQSDYDSYKVRVHSVLKQKSTGPGQAEINSEIKKKYETELVKLTTELQQMKSKLASNLADHEDLLVEHEQLASRHEQLLQESEERREGMEKVLREEEARHSLQSQEQTELIIQLRHEIEEVTAAFKTQLHGLQDEHNKVVCGLKEDLEVAQNEFNRLQQEADSRVLAKSNAASGPSSSEGAPHPQTLERPPNEQRSSGEGMEQSELDSATSSIPPTPLSLDDPSLSFERLLSVGNGEVSNQEHKHSSSDVKLHKQLKIAYRKIEHLTELLRESEASSLRLGDQAKLLKEEIRRLERNQEREKGVSNMEYLKNVILKFLHNEGDERKSLIPIIEKLLLLSPQEIKYLEDTIVKGKPSELPGADPDKGLAGSKLSSFSSYVHRWTGY